MALSVRENTLRTIRMTDPRWMPHAIKLTPSSWELLGADLEAVVLRHPKTCPGWRAGQLDWRRIRHKPAGS